MNAIAWITVVMRGGPVLMSCWFAKYRPNLEGSFIIETSEAVLMDIQPENPGHMRVVPVEHYVGLEDLPSEVGTTMFSVAQKVVVL